MTPEKHFQIFCLILIIIIIIMIIIIIIIKLGHQANFSFFNTVMVSTETDGHLDHSHKRVAMLGQ